MTGKDIPAWIADGGNNAGTIAKSQIKIGDGNTNPDAGLHSSVATPSVETGKGAPPSGSDAFDNATTWAMDGQSSEAKRRRATEKPRQRTESEIEQLIADIPDGASVTLRSPKGAPHTYFREGGKFYLENEKNAERKTDQAYRVRNRLRFQTCTIESVVPSVIEPVPPVALADPALAIAPIPDPMPAQSVGSPKSSDVPLVVNATELQKGNAQPTQEELAEAQDKERKTEERTGLVQDAQTPEELCDIVASFDVMASDDWDEIPGDELVRHLRRVLTLSRRENFGTYEGFEEAWEKERTNVPKAYGIQEKFDAFLREKMRLEFSQPLPSVMTPEEGTAKEKEKKQPTQEELAGVKSFDELFVVLERYDGIHNSKGFTLQELKNLINQFRVHKIKLDNIPLELGLQGVVNELCGLEQSMNTVKKIKEDDVSRQIQVQIKSLEGELDDLRAKYVKKDYEETSVWKRLSRVFGRKLEPSNEENEINEKTKYQQKLQELLDVRLRLARLGREGDELKEAMAGELQYFITESKIKLYSARTEVKGTGYIEKVGNYYNDLVRKHPWVSAGIGLTLLGAGLASGGAAPATLTLAVFLKRAIATPGLFVTTDSLLGKASAYFRDKSIKEDVEKEKQKTLEEMEEFIKAMNANCDKALLKCKVIGRLQKSIAALAAGFLFGHTAIAAYEHFTSAGITEPVKVAGAVVKGATDATQAGAENASAESALPKDKGWTLDDAKQDTAPAPSAPVPSAYARSYPGHFDSPSGVATEAAKNAVGVPSGVGDNIYEISKGDTVDGLIGSYLSEHYQNFDGMTDGQKTHAINALERQLRHLSPEQLKLAGIGSGNIHSIQVKELVDLDKLFSADDADKVMGKAANISVAAQHSIEQNNVKIAEWVKTHPGVPINEVVIENQILHSNPSSGVSLTDVNGSRAQYIPSGGAPSGLESAATAPAEVAPSPSVKDIISQAPEKLSSPQQARLNDWYMQIFRTENSTGGKDWVFDKKSILKTKLTDIVRVSDGKMIFAPGFDAQQVKNFKEFSDALPKEFSKGQATLAEFVKAKPDITVNEYLARVAQNVKPGTRIGLYTTTN